MLRSRCSFSGSSHFSAVTAALLLIPRSKIRRPAAWQKPMPAMAALTTSAIMAVPHRPFDVRAMGNSQSEQCAIIKPRQGGNGPFDLLLAFEAARLGGALFCNARI